MRGPIDYFVIAFDGAQYDGSILRELDELVDDGIISVLDLMIVNKDRRGTITELNISHLDDKETVTFMKKYQQNDSRIDKDDLDEVGSIIDINSTAALLIVEYLWAIPLKKAILKKDGYLVAEGRIHPEEAAKIEQGE